MPPTDDAVARAVRSFAAQAVDLAAHELNNRLAVMRETVGLMEDLARAGKAGAPGAARAQASLDDQVGRALNIVRALSGLGGSLGAADGGFDAGGVLGDLLGLAERWARRHSLRIESEIASGARVASGDPALFLCLVNRLLERGADGLGPGGVLGVRLRVEGGRVRVEFRATGERSRGKGTGQDEEEADRGLAERLGGKLLSEEGDVTTIELAAAR